TLQATVAWSYDLLDPTDQTVFQRLSVMAASFDLDAAEAIATGGKVEQWEVMDALGRLVGKSMVTAIRGGGEVRYRLLEPLRQFGADRLQDAADHADAHERYARYWFTQAVTIGPAIETRQADAWLLDALERDRDHYRAAFDY